MSILEANPQFSWMVGDTILDLEAAKKAGIFSVGVLCGYGEKEELQKYSKHIKNNSLEAVEFINSL
jgi:phosphoglycolate phosphatase